MLNFSKKNILFGVAEEIPANKSSEIFRLFKKKDAEERWLLTDSAKELITP